MHADFASKYRELWDRHWWWRARHARIKQLIGSLKDVPQGDVLDVGCGDALLFDDLAGFGTVYGVEPNGDLIHPDNLHLDRIQVQPFGPDYSTERRFGLITMLDVLEHIEDDGGTLNRVFELLRPGGYLVMTVPALTWLWSMHDVANGHYRRYTRAELASKLDQHRFEILQSAYMFGWTIAPMLLRRLVSPAGREMADASGYSVDLPPAPVNRAMYWLTRMELAVTGTSGPPVGSSVVAVARKPTAPRAS